MSVHNFTKLLESTDVAYMQAVESGDMDTAQRMVDEAARRAGYTVGPVYHGTDAKFTEFRARSSGADEGLIFFSRVPRAYGKYIGKYFLRGTERLVGDGSRGRDRKLVDGRWQYEDGSFADKTVTAEGGDTLIVGSPSQIKSADPVTYDANGNVIPLSQRFNQSSNDI